MTPFQRVFSLFKISRPPRRILGVGGVLAALAACFVLVVLLPNSRLDHTDPASMSGPEAAFFSFNMFILPGAAVFLALAALFETRIPPRAVLWLAATLLAALGGCGLSLAMWMDSGFDFTGSAVFLLTIVVSVCLLFSLPGIYYSLRTVPEIHAARQAGQAERLLAFVAMYGEIGFSDLSNRADVPVEQVDNLVDDLLRSGRLAGFMDTPRKRVYTAACLAEKQRLLLEVVRIQGRIHLEELARAISAPVALTRDWVYQIVDRGQFNGAINWAQGWLYSATAHRIGPDSQCPNCGGQLSPGAQGAIVCLHCGAEVFGRPPG